MALRTLLSYGLASMLVACSEAPSSMVAVPAGMIMMGCNEPLDMLCRGDELPYHPVALDRFEIDETEVTQGAYEECADAGACSIPPRGYDPAATPDLPVVQVNWDDADAYCRWNRKRLPTEAEWEEAARGIDERIYPWGSTVPDCELTNFAGCGDATEDVGGHRGGVSPYGALDMAGNVLEWVDDFYDAAYYATSPVADPQGPVTGDYHVQRGGSFLGDPQTVRVSYRVKGFPVGLANVGFRCAR